MPATGGIVLTIGHSTHSMEAFVDLLQRHEVTAVADVRAAPYSRFNPQFNRESLASSLDAHGIAYVFLGSELGGRSEDPACYDNGRICYDRLGGTRSFQKGLDRVTQGATRHRIALMCSEKEPLECHRGLLVAPALEARGASVVHIRPEGGLELHADAMCRLIAMHDGLKRENDHLKQQLAAARRAGRRHAAPIRQGPSRRLFAADVPGRAGAGYEASRLPPAPGAGRPHSAPVPAACPDCGGAVASSHVVAVSAPDDPDRLRSRGGLLAVSAAGPGPAPAETSDALGAAGAQLGPRRHARRTAYRVGPAGEGRPRSGDAVRSVGDRGRPGPSVAPHGRRGGARVCGSARANPSQSTGHAR